MEDNTLTGIIVLLSLILIVLVINTLINLFRYIDNANEIKSKQERKNIEKIIDEKLKK